MTINDDILNATILHMVWLERYKSSEVKKIVALLAKADSDLVEQIAARLIKIEDRGYDIGPDTTKRLNDLLKAIREQRAEAYAALNDATQSELFDFSKYESDFQGKIITNAASAAGASIELSATSISQLRAIVTKQPFQGRLLREWYTGLGSAQAQRISDAVRIGIVEGQTTDQIVRRIRGTRARQYRDGILEIGRRDAQSVVRTAVAHVANRAKDDLYAANDDIVKGVKWVSTLDSRTSAICRSRDGKIYPVDSGPRPPAHFSCRSTTVPYLGLDSIEGMRASAIGPVPDDMNYEQWLKLQSPAVQDEVLGKAKGKLFREGNLSLDRFSDDTGRSYTLQELMERDADTFDEVFGGAPARNTAQKVAQEAEFVDYIGGKTYDRLKAGVEKAMRESGVSSYGMTEAEKVAIHAYTMGGEEVYYERMNKALRSGDAEAIARVAPMANVLDNALEKLPVYDGTVYRVTKELPGSVTKKLMAGGEYSDPAFMSATKKDLGTIFGEDYRFTIVKSRQGREIAGFSAYGSREDEVLFPRSAKFDILEAGQDDNTGFFEVILNDKD